MVAKNEYDSAVRALMHTYTSILQVNLTTDTYQVIKSADETGGGVLSSSSFSKCILDYARTGHIFEDDLETYCVKTNLGYLRDCYESGNDSMSIRYRRKVDDSYRWTLMDVVRDSVYHPKNQVVYVYIKDIDDTNADDVKKQREMEYICKHDSLTKLQNYYAFKQFCSLFGMLHRNHSVGVIFSDLNGLKIINDVQGHTAGNEYIMGYCEKLQELFPQNSLYRISGDEFLTVFVDVEKKVFVDKARQLLVWLESQPVPMASVGIEWKRSADDLMEAVKGAEEEMYLDKKRFYQEHPEYRREAVEASFSQEMNAIILDLARAYPTLGIIDTKNDTYRLIKMDKAIGNTIVRSTYSEYVDYFLNELMTPESKKDVEKIAGVVRLKRALRDQESVSATFQMKNGSWRQITFRAIERKNSIPTKIVFYASEMNRYLSETLEHDLEIKTNYELLQGLCYDYSLLTWIDLDSQHVHIKMNNGLPGDYLKVLQSETYNESRIWFAQKYVEEPDREHFLRDTAIAKVVEKLKEREYYSVYVRTTGKLHETDKVNYSKFFFYRIADGSNRIMFATKNITDMVKQNSEILEQTIEATDVLMDQDIIDRLFYSIQTNRY